MTSLLMTLCLSSGLMEPNAWNVLQQRFAKADDDLQQCDLLKAIVELNDPQAKPLLESLLKSKSERLQEIAACGLIRQGHYSPKIRDIFFRPQGEFADPSVKLQLLDQCTIPDGLASDMVNAIIEDPNKADNLTLLWLRQSPKNDLRLLNYLGNAIQVSGGDVQASLLRQSAMMLLIKYGADARPVQQDLEGALSSETRMLEAGAVVALLQINPHHSGARRRTFEVFNDAHELQLHLATQFRERPQALASVQKLVAPKLVFLKDTVAQAMLLQAIRNLEKIEPETLTACRNCLDADSIRVRLEAAMAVYRHQPKDESVLLDAARLAFENHRVGFAHTLGEYLLTQSQVPDPVLEIAIARMRKVEPQIGNLLAALILKLRPSHGDALEFLKGELQNHRSLRYLMACEAIVRMGKPHRVLNQELLRIIQTSETAELDKVAAAWRACKP